MNINKFFDKYLDIITHDDKTIRIKNKKIVINDSSRFYGNVNLTKKDNNIYVIKEVYSLEDNRLRYSYVVFENAKAFNTIEKTIDGKEYPIMCIEKYDSANTYIGSIGNIKEITSDKIKNAISKDNTKILKLLKKNKIEELIDII